MHFKCYSLLMPAYPIQQPAFKTIHECFRTMELRIWYFWAPPCEKKPSQNTSSSSKVCQPEYHLPMQLRVKVHILITKYILFSFTHLHISVVSICLPWQRSLVWTYPNPGFFIQNIHSKSKIEGMWWLDNVPNHCCISNCDNTISNTSMMNVRNSHGLWEVPKPYLNGGNSRPAYLRRNPD